MHETYACLGQVAERKEREMDFLASIITNIVTISRYIRIFVGACGTDF